MCQLPGTCTGNRCQQPCSADGWCRKGPLLTPTQTLRAINGTADNMWAAGNDGLLLHWDGGHWKIVETPTSEDINAVWVSDHDDVWLAGKKGTLLHYNGRSITVPNTPGISIPSMDLHSIWGDGSNNVFISSHNGVIIYKNQDMWTLLYPPMENQNPLYGIWGTSKNNVWAVGESGTILHWNGVTLDATHSPGGATFNAIWGNSPSYLWAVNSEGNAYYYNGIDWSQVPDSILNAPSGVILRAIWGNAINNIWIAGDNGYLAHFDGYTYETITSSTPNRIYGLWGSNRNDVWGVGNNGTLIHRNDTYWSNWSSTQNYYALHGVSDSHMVAVGHNGHTLRYDGKNWYTMPTPTTNVLFGVYGKDSSNYWAVGVSGTIMHFDGISWKNLSTPTTQILLDIDGHPHSGLYTVGLNGAVLASSDGFTWSDGDPGNQLSSSIDFHSVWISPTQGTPWIGGVVGTLDMVFMYEASNWLDQSIPFFSEIKSIFGFDNNNLYVAGAGGNIMIREDSIWAPQTSNTSKTIRDVWGNDPAFVFAVGHDATLLKEIPDNKWQQMSIPQHPTNQEPILYGIFGLTSSSAWVVGEDGYIIEFNP
jgi:hypothetical protein